LENKRNDKKNKKEARPRRGIERKRTEETAHNPTHDPPAVRIGGHQAPGIDVGQELSIEAGRCLMQTSRDRRGSATLARPEPIA
jgi:hypothetical protein